MSFYLDQLYPKAPHQLIEQLSCDSRMPMHNAMFFCIRGVVYNGHNFIKQAIENGAKVIIYDEDIDKEYNAIFIRVKDTVEFLNRIADFFYGSPSKSVNGYVISGCYGKTAVNYLLCELLKHYEKTGYISERGIDDGKDLLMNKSRTLTIIDFFRCLSKMKENGIKNVVLESSVQNLSYGKLDGIAPSAFIYTATGQEAVEYRDMNREYENRLFEYMHQLNRDTLVVMNADDMLYEEMTRNTTNPNITYGKSDIADFRITSVDLRTDGSSFNIIADQEKYHVETMLLGMSSIYNLTAVLAALSQRYDLKSLIQYVKEIKPVKGSMEPVLENQGFTVIVDGASNYQTISRIYDFAEGISKDHRIIAVIPVNYIDNALKLADLMKLSNDICSLVILTSGDSNKNDLTELLEKAESYFMKNRCVIIDDRQTAIETALDSANKEDVVLLLGKGEENYMNKNGNRVAYATDAVIAHNHLKKLQDSENDLYFDL